MATEEPDVQEDVKTNEPEENSGKEEKSEPEPTPVDHNKKALLADLYKERTARKELQSQLSDVTKQLEELTGASEELEALTKKYQRLEQFILGSNTDIGKALDSRTLTQRLFESDDEIDSILQDWHKDNPTTTSRALTGSNDSSPSAPSVGDLLRVAAGMGG